ncbi:uncharacterized protein LOC127010791 [Drosophila biarmipes]|uniref:uncharacterized protein LOC127010791 n=1 Tax=Drosophila biarmipes TaxID=125945 RepID=UPI0021CC8BE8|nr:uncharacterized protein LOC127010791 [Drosophila biarmipes]
MIHLKVTKNALGEPFLFDYAARAPLLWFWSGSQFGVCRNVICSSNNSFGLIIILWIQLLLLAQLQLRSSPGSPPEPVLMPCQANIAVRRQSSSPKLHMLYD